MDGVKNLLRRPRKENGTSRVNDRSLLERVGLPQFGESSKDSGRPKRSCELKLIESDPLNGSSIQVFKVLLAFIIVFPAPSSHCVSKPAAPCRREPKP